jgi:DNA-binding response OmpR family regulator
MAAHRVLVVDDDVEILSMLNLRLTKRGYAVSTASDGASALELAARERPAVVLLDVMMPGMSGWEVAKALRADAATAGTKIIMVSAIGAAVNEMTAAVSGADAHVDKPFEFAALEATIARLLA